jgi:hypothetical protein
MYQLQMLETMIAWQQQAWDQWFRFVTSFYPGITLPGDPAAALEATGAAEAGAEELEAGPRRSARKRA